MSYQFLETKVENGILLVTLSREGQLNALNIEMISELRRVFESLDQEKDGVRGVVITGKGDKAFAAGADIKELTRFTAEESAVITQDGHTTFGLIEKMKIPVVAAINGFALGGGFEVALACHIRVAGSTAKVGLPESTLGLIPGYGGTQRLTRITGRAKAIELMCSGELITAADAADLGIVSYVTEPGQEVAKACEIIEKLTTYAPEPVGKILEATLLSSNHPEDGYRFEQKAFADLLQTENAKEGMKAFVEKRKAEFIRRSTIV